MSDKYLFSQGNVSFEKGDYLRAISFYSNAIDINPDEINYYKSRCISFIKNENFEQAIRDANIVIEKYPESDSSYILLGISFLSSNQIEKAEDAFLRALQINPHNMITKNYLEKIQQSRQNDFRTLQSFDESFQEIFQQYIQEPSIINNFAGNTPMLDALNQYMDRFDRPTTIRYQNLNNEILRYQNNDSLIHILNEAKTNFKQNQFEEAIKLCQQGVMLCNENTPSTTITSLFQITTSSFMKMGKIDEAVNYSHHFIEISEKNGFEINGSIQKNCEYIQIASQNIRDRLEREEAISYLKQFRKSDTDISDFFRGEITNSIKNNQIEKAVQISMYAVILLPTDADLHYTRAKVNYKIGQFDLSLSECQKAIQIRPDFFKAELLAAKCFIGKNEPKNARTFCMKALLHNRESLKAAEMVGLIENQIQAMKEAKIQEILQRQKDERERRLREEEELAKMREAAANPGDDGSVGDGENDSEKGSGKKKKKKSSLGKKNKQQQQQLSVSFENEHPHSQPVPRVRQFDAHLHIEQPSFPSSFQAFNRGQSNMDSITLRVPEDYNHQPLENSPNFDQNDQNINNNDQAGDDIVNQADEEAAAQMNNNNNNILFFGGNEMHPHSQPPRFGSFRNEPILSVHEEQLNRAAGTRDQFGSRQRMSDPPPRNNNNDVVFLQPGFGGQARHPFGHNERGFFTMQQQNFSQFRSQENEEQIHQNQQQHFFSQYQQNQQQINIENYEQQQNLHNVEQFQQQNVDHYVQHQEINNEFNNESNFNQQNFGHFDHNNNNNNNDDDDDEQPGIENFNQQNGGQQRNFGQNFSQFGNNKNRNNFNQFRNNNDDINGFHYNQQNDQNSFNFQYPHSQPPPRFQNGHSPFQSSFGAFQQSRISDPVERQQQNFPILGRPQNNLQQNFQNVQQFQPPNQNQNHQQNQNQGGVSQFQFTRHTQPHNQ